MHINISKVNFKSIGINIAKVDFGLYDSGGVEYYGMYITPAGDNAIGIIPNANYYDLHGKYLKYSFDGKTWNDWDGGVSIEPGQKMYLRGEDDYVWNSSTSGKLIKSTSYYNVGGDISSLTNGIVEVKNYAFCKLFNGDNYIKDASNLILPATTLSNNCYGDMFNGCTALKTAPELPATKLSINCYWNMFSGCTSLVSAPSLPATALASYCYSGIFNGCTSLTTAPALPATALASYCYRSMFSGCTSLTTAPALPATKLNGGCYQRMFQGCTSLTTAPELPAMKLVADCYYSMFQDCTSLNNITMLATDISAVACLASWVSGVASTGTFIKAASMTSLPTGNSGIPTGWTVLDYYPTEYLTLSALEDGEITITIPAAVNATYATSISYSKDKSSWTPTTIDDTDQTISIPVSSGEDVYLKGEARQWTGTEGGLYNTNINSTANIIASGNIMSLLYEDGFKDKIAFPGRSQYAFRGLFKDNSHLINAENLILPVTKLLYRCYENMFNGCTSLTTAPELPAATLSSRCYENMFSGCTSLTTAPELPATTLRVGCYDFMFYSCTSLTTAPELPATKLANNCYYGMFQGCTSLTTAPALPATELVDYCYHYMFSGCAALETAPALPATTLTQQCYMNMFNGCSKLNNITMLATDISAKNCLTDWVKGVASTGTFTKASAMTSLPTGASGIPEGWTVVNK